MSKETIEREVNLSRLVTPSFLSIVNKPANQIAFKVVRSQAEANVPVVRKARTKRNDTLMQLSFPDTMDEADVSLYLDTYGMEGYQLEQTGTTWIAKKPGYQRSAEKSVEKTISVTLQQGVKATIALPNQTSDKPKSKDRISMVALEFEKDYYENDQEAIDWLVKNNIDFSKSGIKNTDETILINRADVIESTEIKKVKLEDGVFGLISRSDTQNVPIAYNTGVSEAAYGNWGWGQMDFSAYLADIEFSDAAPEAVDVLYTVINEILFYSYLDTATRKKLVDDAVQQFSQYIGSLLDALPSQVVNATRSQLDKEKIMTKEITAEVKNAATEDVKTEVKQEVVATAADEVKDEVKAPAYVTRGDMEAAIAEAVKLLMDAIQSEPDDGTASVTNSDKKEVVAEVQNSDSVLTDIQKAVSEGMKQIGERIAALEGQTTVRSDSGDGKQTEKDAFKGMFGNLRGN